MTHLSTSLPNPIPASAVAMLEVNLEGVLDRIGESIMESPRTATIGMAPRRRRLGVVLAVAAFAIAIVGSVLVSQRDRESNAWAAEDIAFAQRTPLLLPTTGDWRVKRVDQYGEKFASGEVELKNTRSGANMTMFWVRPKDQPSLIADRALEAEPVRGVTVAGRPATSFYSFARPHGAAPGSAYSAFWNYRGSGIRIETWLTGIPSRAQRDQFKALLATIQPVTIGEWLGAMPKSYLLPAAIAQKGREIVADVALPPGYDAVRVTDSLSVATEKRLANYMLIDVECGWLDRWNAARKRGDRKTMREVTQAVSGYKNWHYMKPRKSPDGTSYYMGAEYYDALKHDGVITTRLPDGRVLRRNIWAAQKSSLIGLDYKSALGCAYSP